MGRAFAALYDVCMAPSEAMGLRRMRRRLLAHARGRVLEVGAGTGANLPLYPTEAAVVATEPDARMARVMVCGAAPGAYRRRKKAQGKRAVNGAYRYSL